MGDKIIIVINEKRFSLTWKDADDLFKALNFLFECKLADEDDGNTEANT